MTALSADRGTPCRKAEEFELPVHAGVIVFRGALLAVNAVGELLRPQDTGAVSIAGVAQTASSDFYPGVTSLPGQFPSGGVVATEPALTVKFRRKLAAAFANSVGADLIAAANWGATAYAVDDGTVALTSNGGARLAVGPIRGVDQFGVWVEI